MFGPFDMLGLLGRLNLAFIAFLLLLLPSAHAYIPAIAVNDTSALNLTDSSSLHLKYFAPDGVFDAQISYQLEADVRTGGIDNGALIHFNETFAGDNRTTATPWIAMISCDYNETNASDTWDIFTLARDRGAVAALLYTLTAESCLINQDYIQNFEKPVDVFSTKMKSSAQLIESSFSNTNSSFYGYNFTILNSSTDVVTAAINSTNFDFPTRTYLIATLAAKNSTGQAEPAPPPAATTTAPATKSNSGRSLAMIILYCISGIVTTLFVTVVMIGAIRAVRHPELYGPQADLENGAVPQTRAQGIGQAILDTFPVVKFSRSRPPTAQTQAKTLLDYPTYGDGTDTPMKEVELGQTEYHELANREPPTVVPGPDPMRDRRKSQHTSWVVDSEDSFHSASEHQASRKPSTDERPEIAAAARAIAEQSVIDTRRRSLVAGPSKPRARPESTDARTSQPTNETVEDEEEESCPICLLEFEEGEDIRVLPCQQSHRYHKSCIDPWLLEVSSSCPLCRRDFSNPLNTGDPTSSSSTRPSSTNDARPSGDGSGHGRSGQEDFSSAPASSTNRFRRYLAFVRSERRRSQVRGIHLNLGPNSSDRHRRLASTSDGGDTGVGDDRPSGARHHESATGYGRDGSNSAGAGANGQAAGNGSFWTRRRERRDRRREGRSEQMGPGPF